MVQGVFQRLWKRWESFKYEAQLLPLVVQFLPPVVFPQDLNLDSANLSPNQ